MPQVQTSHLAALESERPVEGSDTLLRVGSTQIAVRSVEMRLRLLCYRPPNIDCATVGFLSKATVLLEEIKLTRKIFYGNNFAEGDLGEAGNGHQSIAIGLPRVPAAAI